MKKGVSDGCTGGSWLKDDCIGLPSSCKSNKVVLQGSLIDNELTEKDEMSYSEIRLKYLECKRLFASGFLHYEPVMNALYLQLMKQEKSLPFCYAYKQKR